MRNNLLILIAVFALTISPAYVFAPSHPTESPNFIDDILDTPECPENTVCETQFVIPFSEFITEGMLVVLGVVTVVGIITIVVLRRIRR